MVVGIILLACAITLWFFLFWLETRESEKKQEKDVRESEIGKTGFLKGRIYHESRSKRS